MDIQDVDTPALLLDLDALDFNIQKMAKFLREAGCALRPTIKVHKTPQIAKRQMDAGAVGLTCSKVSEAEVMVDAGMPHVMISNQIVGHNKVGRLARLAKRADVTVAVDDAENAEMISKEAKRQGVRIGVIIEINVGMNRAGVAPGKPVLSLARRLKGMKDLEFRGVMGYEGHLQEIPELRERTSLVKESLGQMIESVRLMEREGIESEIVSCGGTNTYSISSRIEGVTDIEAGSYVFMDGFHDVAGVDFRHSLTVLSTVTSRPDDRRALIDAGLKAFSGGWTELNMMPRPKDVEGMKFENLSEEHGHLLLSKGAELRVGDRIQFYPYYAPTTINLFDRLYCLRGERVVQEWPIAGRGKSQ